MLQICYLGTVFAVVFYLVFGIAVRLMDLSSERRNTAHLGILITSLSILIVSFISAAILLLQKGSVLYGVLNLAFALLVIFVLTSILIELHNITRKIKIRRFMVLFDIVDRFINEGKSMDEIMHYLTDIQKLTVKEATDFLEFISDKENYQFLADVNEKIQEAKLLGRIAD